jgi:hypothetical protein
MLDEKSRMARQSSRAIDLTAKRMPISRRNAKNGPNSLNIQHFQHFHAALPNDPPLP